MKRYFIDKNYTHRSIEIHMNDHGNEDRYQKEVYEKALSLVISNDFKSIFDIGTGSGFKLVKYFDNYDTIGLDIPEVIEKTQKIYPNKKWTSDFKPVSSYDLIIASDVIEHFLDPDILLDLVELCEPKMIVFSTPDRSLMLNGDLTVDMGPPKNLHHIREWTKDEFYNYISDRFKILEHYISDYRYKTQLIVATLKENK